MSAAQPNLRLSIYEGNHELLVGALARGDVDELMAFREKAPGMPYAHPTVEHFAPLFVTLGAAAKPDDAPETAVEGFWWGLSKRAFQVG